MSNIIALCGKKQSGKSSTAKFLCAHEMLRLGIIQNLVCYDDGDCGTTNPDGQNIVIDFYSQDTQTMSFLADNLDPTISCFSFAKRLKYAMKLIFNIPINIMYGTDEQKNSLSNVRLKDFYGKMEINEIKQMKTKMNADDFLTVRQVMQLFGTNVCRGIYDRCWIDGLLTDIADSNTALAIVDDCRFANEVKMLKEAGAICIKLARNPFEDSHASETSLDSVPDSDFDLVIDNRNMTLQDKNDAIVKFLMSKGLIDQAYQDSGVIKAKGTLS